MSKKTTSTDSGVDLRDKFGKLMRSSLIAASKSGNPILDEFAQHFGEDPASLPLIQDSYPYHLIINMQAGIDAFLARPTVTESRELGVVVPTAGSWGRLSDLLLPPSFPMPAPRRGVVEDHRREAGYKNWIRCLTQGAILYKDEHGPGVIWVQAFVAGQPNFGLRLEAMALTSERSASIVDEIRTLGIEHSPYRGECIMVNVIKGVLKPQFEERPSDIKAEDVILPPGLLEKVEKHVIGISRYGDELKDAKRHLRRGLLLWGRPGTGKTHTIRYLASQLPEHTVLLLPGSKLENLHALNDLIEICSPGIVVLDDVDYIAEDRTMPSMAESHNLFELLETLDGVKPDADLLFVLTTNRADTLEPAVAARPGRVDQVAEIPPPDADCRRRLFDLYSKNMNLEITEDQIEAIIKRTEGVTGSFFKEVHRRATLNAAMAQGGDDSNVLVTHDHIHAVIEEMLDPNNPLTSKMLGLEGDEHTLVGAQQVPNDQGLNISISVNGAEGDAVIAKIG